MKTTTINRIAKLTLTLLLGTLTFSCGKMGTETGNPMDTVYGPPPDCKSTGRCAPVPMVGMMTGLITDKVISCFPTNPPDYVPVHDAITHQTGLNLEMNLAFQTFKSLYDAYSNRKVVINDLQYRACMEEMQKLTCDSQVFTDAYNVNDQHNYSKIHRMLKASASCQTAFTLVETL